MKRVLLVEGSAKLGSALRTALSDLSVAAPPRTEFDVTTGNAEGVLATYPCDVLINCAAFVNVDRCEAVPEGAF
jgi:dTDP-4-dehydrorhamnose reductase